MVSPCLFLLALLLPGRDTIITGLVSHPPAPAPITIRILNTSPAPLHNLFLEWSVETGGSITRKGKITILTLASQHPTLIRLPLRLPDDTAGESFLVLRYRSATVLLAEQEFLLKPYRPTLSIPPTGEITQTEDNDIFTLHSPTIRISFNRQTGWLVHYEIKGIDLLDDTLGLRSNFRWPGYNDSATAPQPHLQLFSNTTSPEQMIVRTEYTLPATASLLHLSYTINAGGEMLVTQQVEPDTTQPPPRPWSLPCFGMQWILPPGYDSITGYGPLDSTWIGIFHDHPILPSSSDPNTRAASTRTGIRWWAITDTDGNGLQFIADTPLLNTSAFRCFDSNLTTASDHPAARPQIQISIDLPTHSGPTTQPESPNLTTMGNLRYAYKVKPLIASRISKHP